MSTDAADAEAHANDQGGKMRGSSLPWLWGRHLRPHLAALVTAFVLMGLEGATLGALSYLIRPLFDTVFAGSDRSLVPVVALAIAGVFLFRAITGFSHAVILARHSERVSASLQSELLAHVMRLDIPFFKDHPPGQLIERIRGDCAAFRALWQPVMTAIGRDVVGLLSLFGVALWVDWRWTLIAVIGAPLLAWPLNALQARVSGTARGARAAAGQLATRLDEIFHGITTIRLTGHEAAESRRYGQAMDGFLRAQARSDTASAAIPALIDVVAAMGFGGVMIYGGYQIMDGEKSVGEFMAFFVAIGLIFEPLRRLGAVSGQWAQARALLERMQDLLQIAPTIHAPLAPRAIPNPPLGHVISLQNVSFAYDDVTVLNGLSFSAEPGQVTALVGPSGAGKTTVFSLLTRLIDPLDGQVLLSGQDIRAFDPAALRALFAVVGQENALFDASIAENLAMGHAFLGQEDMKAALRAAQVDDFVSSLPLGLETPAGPRGSALSGGQRQRIAIARALARQVPILLLDEATSALDAKTEALLADTLARARPGCTTIVIAHRLATIRAADKIIVMDKGRAVESGTHDQLLAKGGLYAHLHALQFKEE